MYFSLYDVHSGFFNGAKLFGPDEDQKAAGAMFIIMGLLWILAVPLAIFLMFLVSKTGLEQSLGIPPSSF